MYSQIKNTKKNKTLEIIYNSKKRPHKIVIYSKSYCAAVIDLDTNTYK